MLFIYPFVFFNWWLTLKIKWQPVFFSILAVSNNVFIWMFPTFSLISIHYYYLRFSPTLRCFSWIMIIISQLLPTALKHFHSLLILLNNDISNNLFFIAGSIFLKCGLPLHDVHKYVYVNKLWTLLQLFQYLVHKERIIWVIIQVTNWSLIESPTKIYCY